MVGRGQALTREGRIRHGLVPTHRQLDTAQRPFGYAASPGGRAGVVQSHREIGTSPAPMKGCGPSLTKGSFQYSFRWYPPASTKRLNSSLVNSCRSIRSPPP